MYILYDGDGSRSDNIHTKKEFIKIMERTYIDCKWDFDMPDTGVRVIYTVVYKNWSLPSDFVFFSLDDWMEYTGALLVR